MKINDGNGLYDNQGLCDSLILDCNNLVKQITGGNYVSFCGIVVQMVQKLGNLKEGIKHDLESKNNIIDELKSMNAELQEHNTGIPVDRG